MKNAAERVKGFKTGCFETGCLDAFRRCKTAVMMILRSSVAAALVGSPMRNFGVTSPLWDRLWGTYEEPGIVTVPLRMAPEA